MIVIEGNDSPSQTHTLVCSTTPGAANLTRLGVRAVQAGRRARGIFRWPPLLLRLHHLCPQVGHKQTHVDPVNQAAIWDHWEECLGSFQD